MNPQSDSPIELFQQNNVPTASSVGGSSSNTPIQNSSGILGLGSATDPTKSLSSANLGGIKDTGYSKFLTGILGPMLSVFSGGMFGGKATGNNPIANSLAGGLAMSQGIGNLAGSALGTGLVSPLANGSNSSAAKALGGDILSKLF